MRVAITSRERLQLDVLTCLFSEGRFHVVAADTDCRACVQQAQREGADLFVVDLLGLSIGDAQFLLGAQTFGEFRTIAITDLENQTPDGFTAIASRFDPAKSLLDNTAALGVDLAAAPRGRGRPRMNTHGLQLSPREYEVALLISKGFTNQKIAETMALKEQSVKNLVSTIIRKLHCENRVQVALQLCNRVSSEA